MFVVDYEREFRCGLVFSAWTATKVSCCRKKGFEIGDGKFLK